MAKLNIADIRQEYTKGGLRESELPGDPLSLFSRWLQEAIDAEVDEPTAVIVGTVSPEGRPSTRTVLLKGLHDGKFIFYTNYESRKGNFAQFNYLEQRLDRWHGEGTSNTQPLLNTKHSINNLNSDYYIEDGKFFRIRNVQLAYTFDKSLIAKIRLQALKVYVNIQNLKTWKHNTGYTPELGGTATAFGVDNGSYPVPAVYTFGINLTF